MAVKHVHWLERCSMVNMLVKLYGYSAVTVGHTISAWRIGSVIASGEDIASLSSIPKFTQHRWSGIQGLPDRTGCTFAAAGKAQAKKSLSEIAMSYGNVYVAQVL